MKRIAIFASGKGTNARNIIAYFHHNSIIKIECIVCTNPKAGVIDVANEANIPYYLINRRDLYETDRVLDLLGSSKIDFIVLAGFLWMIPENILNAFPNRIINIHPALLPRHGGAGMYGIRVAEAVVTSKEKETGITIHYLNEKFDDGKIIFQKSIPVEETDTPQSLSEKVHELEYQWFPKIIELLLVS